MRLRRSPYAPQHKLPPIDWQKEQEAVAAMRAAERKVAEGALAAKAAFERSSDPIEQLIERHVAAEERIAALEELVGALTDTFADIVNRQEIA